MYLQNNKLLKWENLYWETKNYKRRMKEYKYKSIRLNKHSKYGIGTDRTVITRSIRKGQMIFGYFVFYADEPLRYETYQHVLEKIGRGKISTNLKKYVNTYLILQEMCRD